jgi:hypothetical protein
MYFINLSGTILITFNRIYLMVNKWENDIINMRVLAREGDRDGNHLADSRNHTLDSSRAITRLVVKLLRHVA